MRLLLAILLPFLAFGQISIHSVSSYPVSPAKDSMQFLIQNPPNSPVVYSKIYGRTLRAWIDSSNFDTSGCNGQIDCDSTGNGKLVRQNSPTITGTLSTGKIVSGDTVIAKKMRANAIQDSGVVNAAILGTGLTGILQSQSITGTGNVMLANSPTTSGTLTASVINASGRITGTNGGAFTNLLTLGGNGVATKLWATDTLFLGSVVSGTIPNQTFLLGTAPGGGGSPNFTTYHLTNLSATILDSLTIMDSIQSQISDSLMGVSRASSGSFVATLTGVTATVTETVYYTVNGNSVDIKFPTDETGTTNSTGMTFTGLPVALMPTTHNAIVYGYVYTTATTEVPGFGVFTNSGTVTFSAMTTFGALFSNTGWANTLVTKGIPAQIFHYNLN